MNKRYRSYLYSLAILLLSAALTLAVKYRPRGLSEEECGPLYRQYAHAPGIEASFVKGFRVNDTLAVDATLLRAKDTAAWERLAEGFRTKNLEAHLTSDKKKVVTYLAPRDHPQLPMDTDIENNELVAISYHTLSIAIFHTHGKNEIIAVNNYNIDLSTTN